MVLFPGDRPYPCMYCPKRFATNSNLRQHIRTHTGERPHVCVYPGCGRGFNDATKLSNHQRTHTGERPFICPVCGNDFVTRNNLKSHMRSHYDPKNGGQRQQKGLQRAPSVQNSKLVTIQRVERFHDNQGDGGKEDIMAIESTIAASCGERQLGQTGSRAAAIVVRLRAASPVERTTTPAQLKQLKIT